MKKYFKYKSNYIIGVPLGLISGALPFLIWYFDHSFMYPVLMLSIGLGYFLLGVLIGDLPLIIFKLKHLYEYSIEPSEELIILSNRIKIPAFIAGSIVLVIISILGIIYLISGAWPLL